MTVYVPPRRERRIEHAAGGGVDGPAPAAVGYQTTVSARAAAAVDHRRFVLGSSTPPVRPRARRRSVPPSTRRRRRVVCSWHASVRTSSDRARRRFLERRRTSSGRCVEAVQVSRVEPQWRLRFAWRSTGTPRAPRRRRAEPHVLRSAYVQARRRGTGLRFPCRRATSPSRADRRASGAVSRRPGLATRARTTKRSMVRVSPVLWSLRDVVTRFRPNGRPSGLNGARSSGCHP